MDGVTTALVAFILACVIFPHVVKNKPQYYAALGCVMLIILLAALGAMVGKPGFSTFIFAMTALLQVGALFLLILSAGGLTVRDLAGELSDTIEVVRRGGEKEIIVPLRGETPGAAKAQRESARQAARDAERERIVLDVPPGQPAYPPAPQAAPRREPDEDRGGIPLA